MALAEGTGLESSFIQDSVGLVGHSLGYGPTLSLQLDSTCLI